MSPTGAVVAMLALVQPGFDGRMSVFESAGAPAARVQTLTWFLLAIATLVTVVVVGVALWAALRPRLERPLPPPPGHYDPREHRTTRVVVGAVAATFAILFLVLGVDFAVGRSIATAPDVENALRVKVTGYQWWWRIEYQDPRPDRMVLTANELHVPVGRTVVVELESNDVIHSLWIPALGGKKDLVPGRRAVTWFRADRAGVLRGQCAEFCGHQHAHMALTVVAHPPEQFARWYEAQLRPAAQPTDSAARTGQALFLTKGCVMCHAVQGIPAGSREGPDLTHVASRRTLAAGTIPNTRGHLAGWITDPQRIKPGVRMPPNQMSPSELHALLAYLETLR